VAAGVSPLHGLVQFFADKRARDHPAGRRSYQVATYPTDAGDNQAVCLCPSTAGAWDQVIRPRESLDYWAVVQLPPDAATFGVRLGKFPPINEVAAR
jgi:hypothetical protein